VAVATHFSSILKKGWRIVGDESFLKVMEEKVFSLLR